MLTGSRIPPNPAFARQGLALCGYGCESFYRGIQAINDIHAQIGRSVDLPLEERVTETHQTFPIISASNRYFTHQSQCPNDVLTHFANDVDPLKHLYNAATQAKRPVVNVADNEVQYYERLVCETSKGR